MSIFSRFFGQKHPEAKPKETESPDTLPAPTQTTVAIINAVPLMIEFPTGGKPAAIHAEETIPAPVHGRAQKIVHTVLTLAENPWVDRAVKMGGGIGLDAAREGPGSYQEFKRVRGTNEDLKCDIQDAAQGQVSAETGNTIIDNTRHQGIGAGKDAVQYSVSALIQNDAANLAAKEYLAYLVNTLINNEQKAFDKLNKNAAEGDHIVAHNRDYLRMLGDINAPAMPSEPVKPFPIHLSSQKIEQFKSAAQMAADMLLPHGHDMTHFPSTADNLFETPATKKPDRAFLNLLVKWNRATKGLSSAELDAYENDFLRRAGENWNKEGKDTRELVMYVLGERQLRAQNNARNLTEAAFQIEVDEFERHVNEVVSNANEIGANPPKGTAHPQGVNEDFDPGSFMPNAPFPKNSKVQQSK